MEKLPPVFLERMQRLLGDEYAAFLQVYSTPARMGLRANTLKLSPQDLRSRLPYALSPVPWCPAGFYLPAEPGPPPPGRHPYHAAGLYYLQEPSAMMVAELLDPQPGERVLDLCAAPGGKTTHLASRMGDNGLLVANETHPRRVWELAENLERWGAHNLLLTNESPQRLAERLAGFFDRVLVDAPCSGEGMFRKSESARRDWSPELVRSCAVRQSAILEEGARLTRPGGVLGYSTCTFNPQENEETLAGFLKRHPDFDLMQMASGTGLSPGKPEWVEAAQAATLERSIRIWPHLAAGEGHFFAAMRRKSGPASASQTMRLRAARNLQTGAFPAPGARNALNDFCQANLSRPAPVLFPEERLRQAGKSIYLLPDEAPDPAGLHALRVGWWLGTLHAAERGGTYRFEPSHALALGLNAGDAQRKLDLEANCAQVLAYLRGEVLDWNKEKEGWVLVCVDGFALGWGRGVQGKLKNHYPRGLRWN